MDPISMDLDESVQSLFLMVELVSLSLMIIFLGSGWKIFQKAGIPGWHACVPIFNIIQLSRISGKSGFYALLLFLPLVNIPACIFLFLGLARNFGKGKKFALGLMLLPLPFFPLLAFDTSSYLGNRRHPRKQISQGEMTAPIKKEQEDNDKSQKTPKAA